MHHSVLITPPAILPVSLTEAKLHLRVDHEDEDTLIEGLIRAATEHLDGWAGILGRCLVEQVWRQDHDRFTRQMIIPLGPVIAVQSITWREPAGQLSTVAPAVYDLRINEAGNAVVRFDADYVFPANLHVKAAPSPSRSRRATRTIRVHRKPVWCDFSWNEDPSWPSSRLTSSKRLHKAINRWD